MTQTAQPAPAPDIQSGYRMRHPRLGNVHVSAVPTGDLPDDQVADTIRMMIGYAQADSRHPAIVARAQSLAGGSDAHTAANIWQWAHRNIVFTLDADMLVGVPGANDDSTGTVGVECLVRPADMDAMITAMGKGRGDCDDFSMTVCALLLAAGIPCSLVTVGSTQSPDPRAYTHVYAAAYPTDGTSRIAMDASHGQYPGWEAPDEMVTRKTEYPVGAAQGSPVLALAAVGVAVWAVVSGTLGRWVRNIRAAVPTLIAEAV